MRTMLFVAAANYALVSVIAAGVPGAGSAVDRVAFGVPHPPARTHQAALAVPRPMMARSVTPDAASQDGDIKTALGVPHHPMGTGDALALRSWSDGTGILGA